MSETDSNDRQTSATTQSRRAIMDRLRSAVVPSAPRPTIDTAQLTTFDDPVAKFVEMLQLVGGDAYLIGEEKEATEILNSIEIFARARQVASLVPAVSAGNVDTSSIDDPHDLSDLDWVIVRGEFGVAENGAIWIEGSTLPHRVMLFIPQYLAIVISKRQVVHHMHEAYARIGTPQPGFGVFVSGPSKTADIEQSLVLGAHGCRKLHVFLTD